MEAYHKLFGEGGNDWIHIKGDSGSLGDGGRGNDYLLSTFEGTLRGGNGDDILESKGEIAVNRMTGGPGADEFRCGGGYNNDQSGSSSNLGDSVEDYNEEEGDTIVGRCARINGEDDDDERKRRLYEARDKVEEKFMPLGRPSLYGVTGIGLDDLHYEIVVTVKTEQDRINFPMSSIDGFPIRVEVGTTSLQEEAAPSGTTEENATAPTTTPPEREEEEQPPEQPEQQQPPQQQNETSSSP